MEQIGTKGLLLRIFIPSAALSLSYLLLGHFCEIPHILLFCLLGTVTLVPVELGIILSGSKRESGVYSLKSAFAGQKEISVRQTVFLAFVFFGIAGLLSVSTAPVENQLLAGVRAAVLDRLPSGFDWTNYEYLRSFPRPVLIFTCVYYVVFNGLAAPITEELFFRGYLTSHYQSQTPRTPILIAVLFSLYHFWMPFNNIFRILAFAPAAYAAYRKKNLYISIVFHCLCNLFSAVSFAAAALS